MLLDVFLPNTLWVRSSIAAILGLLLHYGLFIRGEWHLQTLEIAAAHLLAFSGYVLWLVKAVQWIFSSALRDGLIVFTVYFTTLFLSMTIYRLFFHRLSRERFPGPLSLRVSKLWHVWLCSDNKNHLTLDRLTKEYGEFVRTGPTEVTVTHPDVFTVTDGPGNVCDRAEWYDILEPYLTALIFVRDKKTHDRRRRLWDKGFSKTAIKQYTERALRYVVMMEQIVASSADAGKAVDVETLFSWLSFDIMGDFVYAKDFGMLEQQQWHGFILKLRAGLDPLGLAAPVPWLLSFSFRGLGFLPLVKQWFAMVDLGRQFLKRRMEMPEDDKTGLDVLHYLIENAKEQGMRAEDWRWLVGDSTLAMVAGSDTTSSTLTCLFYELACRPNIAEKLYTELAPVDCHNDQSLQKLQYLNGVCQEALRLYPAVPSGGNRKTPPQGVNIGGRYIPGDVAIVAPRYTIFRREDCFQDAQAFVPERWGEKPEMVLNKACFAPFNIGRYGCVGKQLALAELRLATAILVKNYHIRFEDTSAEYSFPSTIHDKFTAEPGHLPLIFKRR